MTEIKLINLVEKWILDDNVLQRHFVAFETKTAAKIHWAGEIYYDCRWPRPKIDHKGLPWTPAISQSCLAAKVLDDRVTLVFGNDHVIYKFQAVHPMFFQKLRGHLYDMHNRHHYACNEYLR